MNKLGIILLCFCAFSNFSDILALKRIKRNAETENNHAKISKDFVVLQTKGDKNLKDDKKTTKAKSTGEGDTHSLYDTVLETLNDGNAHVHKNEVNAVDSSDHEGHNHDTDAMKELGLASPLAFVLRKRERNLNENPNITHVPLEHQGSKKLPTPDKSEEHGETNVEYMRDLSNVIPYGLGTTNIVDAQVIMPPQTLTSVSLNPFAPIDQLMRYANMLLYKVGMDSQPLDSQHNLKMPLNNFQDVAIDKKAEMLNSLELTQQHPQFMTSPIAFPHKSGKTEGHTRTTIYSRPWIFKSPLATANESDELKEFIGNALANDEAQGHCPMHHNKNNLGEDDMDNEGVVQVCSCHFIKPHKDESYIEHK